MLAITVQAIDEMKRLRAFVVTVAVMLWCGNALAEGFAGIGPAFRLHDLYRLYPNARFTDLKPAWIGSHQRLIDISGSGIDGQLAVKLEHEVQGARFLAKELAIRQARGTLEGWQGWLLESLPARIERLESNPPEDPWEVKDIRWQPTAPVALQIASRRFGIPDSDKEDEQFRRVVEWTKRGVTAFVNKDSQVELFVYTFTLLELACADQKTAPSACTESEQSASQPTQSKRKK